MGCLCPFLGSLKSGNSCFVSDTQGGAAHQMMTTSQTEISRRTTCCGPGFRNRSGLSQGLGFQGEAAHQMMTTSRTETFSEDHRLWSQQAGTTYSARPTRSSTRIVTNSHSSSE